MKRIQTPFSWNSGSSGTGTLNRHLMNVHGLRSDEGQLEKGQSQISGYATPGGAEATPTASSRATSANVSDQE
nr:hypothetical protein Iba_chr01aCG2380 [Ipomoea batatas]